MSKKVLFLLAVLPFLLLTKPNLVNAEENVSSDDHGLLTGFKYHDNAVTFKFDVNSNFRSASFTPTDGCVTFGQDKKGYFNDSIGKTQTISNGGKFHFTCGRKGSKQVANWFNIRTNNGEWATFDRGADKLNFALEGTLKIDFGSEIVVIDDLMLAQGHSGASNNWWCGCADYSAMREKVYGRSITVIASVFDVYGNCLRYEKVKLMRGGYLSPSVVKVAFDV